MGGEVLLEDVGGDMKVDFWSVFVGAAAMVVWMAAQLLVVATVLMQSGLASRW